MEKLFNEAEAPVSTTHNTTQKKATRNDGWFNSITSLGLSRDKKTAGNFIGNKVLEYDTLVSLYANDGLVSTIIDLIPEAAFKNFGHVQNDPDEEFDEGIITKELNRLNAASIFKQASKWNRLMGGALIYIGAMGAGRPETPLKVEKIKNIEFLKVYPVSDIILSDSVFDTDIFSPTFGKVLKYHVKVRAGMSYGEAWIHASRCIPMFGTQVPSGVSTSYDLKVRYWGLSIIQKMWEDIRDYRTALSNVNTLIQESSVSVYNFSDLDEILASGNEAKFQARISAINMTKSAINAVLLGTDEKYTREALTFTGIPEIIDKLHEQLSVDTGIPVSKLFGASPGGLNSTGGAEERQLNDMAIAEQNNLTADIQRFVDMIVSWKGLDTTGDYSWKWNNIVNLTDEQIASQKRIEAEVEATLSRAHQLDIQEGVISPEQSYKLRYEDKLGKQDASFFEGLEPEEPVVAIPGQVKKAPAGADAGKS